MAAESRRSTQRVLRVLLHLASTAQPATAAQIGAACDIPKATLYPMLTDMESEDFVVHIPETRTWALGLSTFEIGSAYLRSRPLERLGRPLLERLSRQVSETSHLAIMQSTDVLYLIKQRSASVRATFITDEGVRLPAHHTAVGRAILMNLPPAQLRALYPTGEELTGHPGTATSRLRHFRKVLAEDRGRGYSTEADQTTRGITCIAAPVFDHLERPVASIGISFPSQRRQPDEHAGLSAKVKATAQALTARLHGRDGA